MVLTDWLRHRSFARGQARKRCRHGDETSRWRATVSRRVEALEHRHLLAAVQPDWVSLMAFGGDYGPFQVTMSPLTQPELVESSAATFAGQTQFQTAGIQQSMQGDDFVAVDVSQTFALSGWTKSGDEFGQRFDPANRQSFGIAEYDSDHLAILPIHVLKFAGATDTTLAVALNPGDTQIRLANAIGWSNSVGESAATRALAWYGYTNSSGQTYADYSYTRHVATGGASGLWDAGSVNLATNTITLNAPWTGPALVAGAAVRNGTSGSEFQFVARNNQPVSGDWTWMLSASAFGGGVFAGGTESSNRFRPGTAFIKPVMVANEHGAPGNFVTWRDVVVRPVAAGTTAQELAQRVIDLSVVTGGDQRHELSLSQDAKPLDAFAWTQELVRVNTAERYDLTAWSVNSREQFDRPMGFASLDIDRKVIHPLHVARFGNATDTHLAATLSPGDMSILVTDATGWSVSPFESAQTRALAWYGYSDSTGHVYPDFSYTRNVAFDFDRGLWGDGGIAFDSIAGAYRITLTAPWVGPTLAAGSAVRNATSGEVFYQFTIHSTESAYGWQQFGGMIGGGVWQNGRRDDARFRPGTAFIQPTFAGGEPLAWRDIHIAPRQASFFGDQPAVTFGGQSLVTASQSLRLLQSDQLIPIDPTREFVLSAQALRGAAVGDGSPVSDQHTLGFTSFDSDGQEILPIHVTRYASATDTTLATALNVGDTTIHLANASGWSNLGPADTRGMAWFGYSDSAGQTYPDYSYTRNVAVDRVNGLWDIGAISGNTITLRSPWSGPALAAGSAIRNAADGERLNAALLDRGTIPNQWTDFSATVSGSWLNGQPQANAFRPGTAFIRPAALLNAVTLSGDDVVSLRNVSVRRSDVLPGSVTADANHQVAVMVDALANDPLAASVPMRILSVTVPKYGSATIVTGGGPSGRDVVRYLSAPWFIGTDSFEYTAQRLTTGEVFQSRITINLSGTNVAQDSAASSILATQGQQIAGNAPPVAADEFGYYAKAYQTSVGQTLVVDGVRWNGLLTNEYRSYGISGGQPLNTGALTVRLLSGPEHGTLNLKHDGTFEYSPNPGFAGTDVFRYEVFDGLKSDATVAAIDVQNSDQALLQQRLRDLVQGFYNFHDSYSNFTFTGLQPTHFDASKNPYLSWRVHLLPYLGYAELYSQFHLNEPWNSAHNLTLLDRMPDIFRTTGDDAATNTTRFQTINGPGNAYFWRRSNGYLVGPRINDYYYQDGTENTLLVLLAGDDKRVPWTQPVDLSFDPAAPVASLGNLPSGRIDGVMVNGSVISLHTDIAPVTFLALATMSGNEVVDADQLRRQEKLREGGLSAVQSFDASLAESRLGTLGLAMHNYYDTNTYFPVANNPAWFDAQGKPKLSWRVHLLPYLGHANLYEQFRLDESWDSANNLPLLSQMPDIFRSAGDAADSVTTRLVTFTGADAPFLRFKTSGNYYGPRINLFADGMSNTILIAEAGADRSVVWTKPDDIAFDINQPLAGLGSLADGRIRTLLADGSRLSLGADVSAATFQALVTPYGHDLADSSTLRSREELRSGVAPRTDADVLNRFKQVGLAMHNFHDIYRKFPIEDLYPAYFDAQGKPKLSWRVWILPFMDQQSLFEQFHLDEPWDSPHNLPLLDQMPDVFRHPGDPTDSTTTRVQQFTGPGAPFLSVLLNGRYSSLKINQITDGTSNTLMAVEAGADKAVPWTSPDDLPFDSTNPIAAMGQLSEFFVGLFFDGNARRLSTPISPALLKAYITHRGGEVINPVGGDIPNPSGVAGVTITPAGGELSAVEGQLAVFDVVLTKAPTADVVLTIASSSLSVAAVSPVTVRFTSANWHVPQRVTLLAVDDALVDGSQTATISVAVDDPNSDNSYDALADRMLDFTALDNDTAGFTITLTGGSTVVSESGTTDTFRVVLTAQPLTDVVIDLFNSDPGEVSVDRTSLTFTSANWNTPQTVTVTGVDDAPVDGTQTTTLTLSIPAASDSAFVRVPPQTVAVATLDSESAGFVVTQSGGVTTVLEHPYALPETRDTFTVALTAQPLSNVVVALASSSLIELTMSVSTLTFTPSNWSTAQTVTVYSVDNNIADGTRLRSVSLTVVPEQSADLFDSAQFVVPVTITDDEQPSIIVNHTGSDTVVSEDGLSDTFTVKLDCQPLTPVVVDVVNNYIPVVALNRTQLTFTPSNWNVPQTVVVTGVDDPWVNGDKLAVMRMTLNAGLSDPLWASTQDEHILVKRLSNDLAGFTITQIGVGNSVTEGVLGDSITVVLTGFPLTNVVLRLTSGDTGEVTTSPATLTFGQADWNVPQRVQLSGVADLTVDGSQTTLVTISIDDAASNDFFDAVSDQTISVTTTDSDVPGFTVTPSGGSTSVSESGTTDSVSVVLTRGPLTDVVLRIVSSDTGEATAAPTTLTFTPSNWSTPQTVTVSGVDDLLVDGNQTSTLTVSIDDAASDDAWDALADRTVSVVTLDNDAPGFSVLATDGSTVVTESGTTDTVAVVLNKAPLSNVVISVGSSDLSEATVSPSTLTFTPANWNVPQSVTITGVDDTLADGDQTTSIVLSILDADSDNAFDPLPNQTVLVTTLNVNHAPTISDVGDQFGNENTATSPIPFTVGDAESAAASLTVSASSSNTTLVPNGNFVFAGTGANRTLVVTPAAGQSGSVTITLTVSDGVDATSNTFLVTINAAPTISDLSDVTTNEDSAITAIPLLIGDVETPADHLTVLVTSSNTTLVPSGNLLVTGSGANRSLTIAPATNANGNTTITVTVHDGAITTSESFVLNVEPMNDAPTLAAITSVTTNEDTPTDAIAFAIGDLESSASSLTLTAASSNTALIPVSGILFGGSGTNRTVTLTPAANQSGVASITVTVSDGSLTATRSFDVTVLPVNDAPAVSPVADQNGTEDTSASVSFVISDLESEASSLTVSATSSNLALVASSDLTLGGNGANRMLTAMPKPNAFGSTTITLTVSDGTATSSRSFVLTIAGINDSPAISDIGDQVTAEDTSTSTLAFTIGDPESAAGNLTVTAASSDTTLVPNGNLVLGGSGVNRSLTITPAADRFGSATIMLTVSDGQRTMSDTFVLTVNAVNDAPTLTELGNVTMAEDSAASLDLLLGDVETSASELTVTVSSSNAALIPADHLTLNGSGAVRTLSLIPAANQFGTATITVAVSDGLATTTDTFVLTVQAVNDPPAISDLFGQSTLEDTPLIGVPFMVGDADTPAGNLTVTATSSNGTLVPNGSIVFGGSGANRTLTVTPAANQFGSTQITIRVSDGIASVTDTFELTVSATNDAPTISDILNQSINEDTTTAAISFTIGDLETNAGSLTITATSSDQTLLPDTSIALSGIGANRTIRLTPTANRFGAATITITVSDGELSATDTLTLTVNSVNDAPAISSIGSQTTLEDTPLPLLEFTIGDIETAAESLTVTATSSNSVLIPAANLILGGTGSLRTLAIVPGSNAFGAANVTVTVSDGQASASTLFAVTVAAVNDTPSISDIVSQSTNEDTATSVIPFVIGDPETPVGNLSITATSSNTQLVPNTRLVIGGSGTLRTLTATPSANLSGSTTITVTISDGSTTTSDSFDLTVNPVNDRPTLTDILNRTILEDSATLAIPFSISDLETTADSLTVTATSSNETLVPNTNIVLTGIGPNRMLTLTPAANQNGTTTITVHVSDGTVTTSDTFVLTVSPVNDPPTLSDIPNQATNEDAVLLVPLNMSDLETAVGSLKVTATSANTTLVPAANIVVSGTGTDRSLRITPAANKFGTSTITVQVSDGVASVTDTFLLTVHSANDPPTIGNIANKSTNEDTATTPISFTIGDVETAAANLIVTATSSNTTLVPNGSVIFSGTGTSRTLRATPARNQFGTTTITVAVSDGTTTATDTFLLTVNSVNDLPTISDLANRTVRTNTPTTAIPFAVSDIETAADNLIVSGTSSNSALVPNANIVFGGSGTSRTVRITPALNRTGTATITVRVQDGISTISDTFVLTVSASASALTATPRSASLLAEESSLTFSPTAVATSNRTASAPLTTGFSTPRDGGVATSFTSSRAINSRINTTPVPIGAKPGVTTPAKSLPTLDTVFESNDWFDRV